MIVTKKGICAKIGLKKEKVRHFEDVSLRNKIDDKVVELLARIMCSLYAHNSMMFGNIVLVNRDPLSNRGFNENITYTIFWKRNRIFTMKECERKLGTRKRSVYIYAEIQQTNNMIISIWMRSIEIWYHLQPPNVTLPSPKT